MPNVVKLIIFTIIIAVTTSVSSICLAENKSECTRKLKIGVSLPLTASATSSGEAVKNSIILADEKYDLNDCVQFLFEDDQLLPKNTLAVVKKFIEIEHVDALIIYGTPTSIAVGDLVERNHLPMIALSILGKVVQDKKYIVKHWCTAERLNQAIGKEVLKRGYKRIAIFSTQNDAMIGLRDLYVNNKLTEVIFNEEYPRESFDFRSSIVKMISHKPDAVYVLLFPPQTGVFVRQLREQGFNGAAFGVHNIEDHSELAVSGDAMNGIWFANGDESAGENYSTDYLLRFGTKTSLGGASGFDSAKMLIEAANQHSDVNKYLHTLKDFSGAFGVYSASDNNDYDFDAVIKIVEKYSFKKISE